MKVQVMFFKPSGKFYTEETVHMNNDLQPWEVLPVLHDQLGGRMASMIAVIMNPPWGYPTLVPEVGS